MDYLPKLMIISNCWQFPYYTLVFGTYTLEFHFSLIIDNFDPQLMYQAYCRQIDGGPSPLYHTKGENLHAKLNIKGVKPLEFYLASEYMMDDVMVISV